jgi:hypothetical protein
MAASYSPRIDLDVGRGVGLELKIGEPPVDDSYGAIVIAEVRAALFAAALLCGRGLPRGRVLPEFAPAAGYARRRGPPHPSLIHDPDRRRTSAL